MVKCFENTIDKARKVFINKIKEYVKENSNRIDIYQGVLLHRWENNNEGEDFYTMCPYFVDCIRVDEDGEVVVDYRGDEDIYVDPLQSFSFDELYNICEKIEEN